MGRRVVSDRAASGGQRVAWGPGACGEAAGRYAGGAVWREVFSGEAVPGGSQESARSGAGKAPRQAWPSATGQRLESELRFKEGTEGLASGAGNGLPPRG